MGFPIGDLFSIRYFLLAGAQTCELFENNLYVMATRKKSKETNSDLIAIIWSAEHFNFKFEKKIRKDGEKNIQL